MTSDLQCCHCEHRLIWTRVSFGGFFWCGLGHWQWFCRAGLHCCDSDTVSAGRDHIPCLLHTHHFISALAKVHSHWAVFSVLDQRPVEKSEASVLVRNWNTTVFCSCCSWNLPRAPPAFPTAVLTWLHTAQGPQWWQRFESSGAFSFLTGRFSVAKELNWAPS